MAELSPEDPRALEGAWAPVAVSVGGQRLEPAQLRVCYLLLEGDGYRIVDRSNQIVDSGHYTVNADTTPCAMDIVGEHGPNAGRTLLAIYRLEGDELTVCYDVEGGARPETLAARREGARLVITYERRAIDLA
ncbi:MAG TPA: TIGR03067 domain-containing protein [Steroidobacteraceae bacterium]|nr:TIGR03067 domain-containing protein [Steroidobacteraceae bacterium]